LLSRQVVGRLDDAQRSTQSLVLHWNMKNEEKMIIGGKMCKHWAFLEKTFEIHKSNENILVNPSPTQKTPLSPRFFAKLTFLFATCKPITFYADQ
jgi:hypothetical protein